MDTKALVGRSEMNKNSNNNNNVKNVENQQSDSTTKSCLWDEIQPETTPEGYGLRTPYGTHFNLDFLKYCQDISQGQVHPDYSQLRHKRRNSGSNSSNSDTNHSESSSAEKDSPLQSEIVQNSSLFETRRRLEAFRSFRRKQPMKHNLSSGDSPLANHRPKLNKENQDTNPQDATGLSSSPSFGNLLNAPLSQQNLHVVREQMVAALARLRHLEHEVKQIPVLQVQVSVLQQEKQKFLSVIKNQNEVTKIPSVTSDSNHWGFSNVPDARGGGCPPPPPKRRYKSVAVGDYDVNEILEKTSGNTQQPASESVDVCIQVQVEMTDSTCGAPTLPEKLHTYTSTSDLTVEPIKSVQDVSTSSNDLISFINAETGMDAVTYKDSETTTNVVVFDVGCQKEKGKMEEKEVLTVNTFIVKFPEDYVDTGTGEDSVYPDPSPLLVDACTSTTQIESQHQETNTDSVVCFDKSCSFKPNMIDFTCNANILPPTSTVETCTEHCETTDAVTQIHILTAEACVSADIRPPSKDATSCTDMISMKDAETDTCVKPNETSDAVTQIYIQTKDACVSADLHPPSKDAASYTDVILKKDAETSLVHPETIDAITQSEITTKEVCVSADLHPPSKDAASHTDAILKKDVETETSMVHPETIDAITQSDIQTKEVCVFADLHPPSKDAESSTYVILKKDVETETSLVHPETIDAITQSDIQTKEVCVSADLHPPSKDAESFTKVIHKKDEVTETEPYKDLSSMYVCTRCSNLESSTQNESETSSSTPGDEDVPSNLMDAMTDTDDLESYTSASDILKDEIGTYVGQVETLLEEQQILLAHKYKELEGVLDGNEEEHLSVNSSIEEQKITVVVQKTSSPILPLIDSNRYQLSKELRLSCITVAKGAKNADTVCHQELENAMVLLQNEWFALTTLPDSNPETAKQFVSGIIDIAPLAVPFIINLADSSGNSALHYAISNKNFGLVCTLAEINGLGVDKCNNAGYTACMLAAITNVETEFEVHVLDILFKKANVNLYAKQAGQTALMLAVIHGCVPAAKSLLRFGANVNAQDEDGSTALMCATEHGHMELVKLLLAHPDCDPAITDNDGSAALNIAMETGQRDIGILLYTQLKLNKPSSDNNS